MAAGPETEARRRPLRSALFWVGLAVTVVFAYLAVRGAHPREVWDALRESEWAWLVPALVVLALGIFLRAVRWWALFAPQTRPPLRAVIDATLIGYFFNNVLPLRAGEAARVVALNRRAGASRAETAATVVLERAFDVGALLVLLFALVPWLPEVSWLRVAGVFAAILVTGAALAAAALALWGDRPLQRLLRPLARVVAAERIEAGAASLARGLVALRRARVAGTAFALTIFSWLVLGASAWLVLLAFDLGLSPVAGVFVVIATGLAAILPSSPAGLGVFEAAVIVALSAYAIDDSPALSYALVLHAVNFLPFVVAGLVVLRGYAPGREAAPGRLPGLRRRLRLPLAASRFSRRDAARDRDRR